MAVACALLAAWEGVLIVNAFPSPAGWLYLAVLGGPALCFPALKFVLRWALKRRWRLVITPDEFRVRTWYGWQVYNRRLAHKFALRRHDRFQLEKERIEQEIRRNKTQGRTYSQLCYFGEAFHISFDYLGQRNDIATVFGRKQAEALVTRLQACDAAMDGRDGRGDGTALAPDDEWNYEPGDIEE